MAVVDGWAEDSRSRFLPRRGVWAVERRPLESAGERNPRQRPAESPEASQRTRLIRPSVRCARKDELRGGWRERAPPRGARPARRLARARVTPLWMRRSTPWGFAFGPPSA